MYRESLLALKSRIETLSEKLKNDRTDLGTRFALKNQRWKRRLYISQRGKCCFCCRMMVADIDFHSQGLLATIEHVIPRSKGGRNHISNYTLSCSPCNNKRGVRGFDSFAKDVKAHIKNGTFHNLMRTSSVRKKIKRDKRLAPRNKFGFYQFSMDSAERFYGNLTVCLKSTFPSMNIAV